ncbi:MAG TPA: exosome complex exonuclease Rrp41 [Candidatus Methanofastidiosa archaeon]|nr:exosome complex exonuclease Rrp41 [Candidatus Methanofastidiosa archaeon]
MTRCDGRKNDELRTVKMEVGVLNRADGSAYVEWGNNKVYAAVYGPKEVIPRFLARNDKAYLRCKYSMAPFSVEDRKRPGPDRRSVEIGKVMAGALAPAIILEDYPNSMIEVLVDVMQADAGTRCAGITAATLALVDAGIPMRGLVSACASGKVDDQIVLDLCKEEDNSGQADVPLAILSRTEDITLLQMDGIMTEEEVDEALSLAIKGCKSIYQMQMDALKSKYGD